jgi:oligoendopeptidase F
MKISQAGSFFRPELLALPAAQLKEYLSAECLKPYRLLLDRIIRFKKHTLSQREEELLALQGEMASTASQVFRQLSDADMKFGTVKNERGETVELTNATYSQFLISPKRAVRKNAFHQYYDEHAWRAAFTPMSFTLEQGNIAPVWKLRCFLTTSLFRFTTI